MKKIITIVGVILIAGFAAIQFFQIDKSQPPIVRAETLESAVVVPPDISLILGRSCNDCHSHATIYPWYSNVQPVGWFLKNHMDGGKQKMNFSLFNTYSAQKKANRLDGICEQVTSREMPLPSYLWIHRSSVLSDSDIKALCDWANQEKGKIVVE